MFSIAHYVSPRDFRFLSGERAHKLLEDDG
jgi:hypothetical protein